MFKVSFSKKKLNLVIILYPSSYTVYVNTITIFFQSFFNLFSTIKLIQLIYIISFLLNVINAFRPHFHHCNGKFSKTIYNGSITHAHQKKKFFFYISWSFGRLVVLPGTLITNKSVSR
jgi:hypothetical protein